MIKLKDLLEQSKVVKLQEQTGGNIEEEIKQIPEEIIELA